MNKNLIKGTLLGLMGLVFMYTNSAIAEGLCTIEIDGNTEHIDYGDYMYLYSNNVYDECSEQYVSCDYEGDDLGEWYSSCPLCKIEIDGNTEYIEYGDDYGDYLYSQESSMDCYNYGENVGCYNEGDDLGEWYSSCEFQPNSPTVLENGDLEVCGTEYISDSNGAVGCITIQGKNVGATTTGYGWNPPSTSYGNYYQWGNNTPRTEANWLTNYSPDDNAWGGGSDNNELIYPVENAGERRGPCDEGYHVPSQGEWYALMDMWAGESVGGQILYYENVNPFYTDFQIPLVGFFDEDGSLSYYCDGNLWNSSSYNGSASSLCFQQDDAYALYARWFQGYAAGLPVRCFKDSALGSSSSEGGDSEIIVNIAALNGGQNTCTLDNYIFSGIFASPSVVFRNISQSMHCVFGNANGSVVTLQLSGDLTDGSGNTIPAGNVRLKNTAWTATPAAVQGASSAIGDYTSLNQTLTLFNKVANKIGEATGSAVDIQVEIPGGTPDGVYNGTLVLSY